MKMIKYHFALHVYDDSSFARFFTNIYCPDVVGGWVLIGDFVRPSFFFLSHSLSFRSASPKTFERQIYIKQIRRHADVQLDTPLLQRAAEKERKTCPFFFCSDLWMRERNFHLRVCTCTSAIRLSSQGSGVLRYAVALHWTWAMPTRSCPPLEAGAHKQTHSRQAHTHLRGWHSL